MKRTVRVGREEEELIGREESNNHVTQCLNTQI